MARILIYSVEEDGTRTVTSIPAGTPLDLMAETAQRERARKIAVACKRTYTQQNYASIFQMTDDLRLFGLIHPSSQRLYRWLKVYQGRETQ